MRRIQQETGIRRETAGAYLKAAGVAIGSPGGWGRRRPAKPANEGSPQLRPGFGARPEPYCQRVRTAFRLHRTLAQQRPERQGHLPGLGRRPRLHRPLPEREALRPPTARTAVPAGLPGDRHAARRGSTGRLRRRPHGARSTNGPLSARGSSSSRSATAARPSGCSPFTPALASGPNCTSKPSGDWAASRAR